MIISPRWWLPSKLKKNAKTRGLTIKIVLGHKPWMAVPLLDKMRLAIDSNPQTNLRLTGQKGELLRGAILVNKPPGKAPSP